ncbi:MAG: two-component regulator propeller domain-containing protein [Terracidiphilus sp.]
MRPTCSSSWRSATKSHGSHFQIVRGAWSRALLCATLVCLVSAARAQLDPTQPISQYVHQTWQDDQGLPQNDVLAITSTRDGYLWLGTEEGLVRFGGIHFVVFDSRSTPGLKNNTITALFEDRDKNLWIGTLGGLFRMTRGVISACPVPEKLSGRCVTAFHQDREGGLWVATDGGGVGRLLSRQFTVYTTRNGLARDAVFSISGGRDGSVWPGSHGGLNQWKNGEFTGRTEYQ